MVWAQEAVQNHKANLHMALRHLLLPEVVGGFADAGDERLNKFLNSVNVGVNLNEAGLMMKFTMPAEEDIAEPDMLVGWLKVFFLRVVAVMLEVAPRYHSQ